MRTNSQLVGQTAESAHQRSKAIILAINRKKDRLLANPAGEEIIEAGDRLITIGTKKQLTALECFCEGGNPNG